MLTACEHAPEADEQDAPVREVSKYGRQFPEREKLEVEINLTDFENFTQLERRLYDSMCIDSIPKFVIELPNETLEIFPWNLWPDYIEDFSKSDVIIVQDDFFIKADRVYPLDSLESIVKKDLANNGKQIGWSEGPEWLLFQVSSEREDLTAFSNLLVLLTKIHDKHNKQNNLNILVSDPFLEDRELIEKERKTHHNNR